MAMAIDDSVYATYIYRDDALESLGWNSPGAWVGGEYLSLGPCRHRGIGEGVAINESHWPL